MGPCSGWLFWSTTFEPMGQTNANAVELLNQASIDLVLDFSWINMLLGWIPGSIGETNKIIIMLSRIFNLVGNKLESYGRIRYRFILDGVHNELIVVYSSNAMLSIPPHYHLVMGSFFI